MSPLALQVENDLVFSGSCDTLVHAHNIHVRVTASFRSACRNDRALHVIRTRNSHNKLIEVHLIAVISGL